MALKIQLRRDIAANWRANNPLLLNGEIGIETDTLKFKVGNGAQRWNAIEFYAFKPGSPNGVATLDASGKVPLSQIPDFNSIEDLESAITSAFSSRTTSSLSEGSNLYFTNARAIAAGQTAFDPIGSANAAVVTAATNTATKISDLVNAAPSTLNTLSELATAIQNNEGYVNDVVNLVAGKQATLIPGSAISISNNTISVISNTFDTKGSAAAAQTVAATDAATKANAAKEAAATDATTKANAAQAAAATDATTKANTAQAAAVALSATDATTKANAARSEAEATAATDASNKATVAKTEAIAAAATDATTKANLAVSSSNSYSDSAILSSINALTTSDIEEGTNKYFTDQRARVAVASDIADAISAIPPGGSGSISSTTDLPEGDNLYFTNARAVTATNAARTNILLSALSSVDDLRTEIQNDLTNYVPNSELGVAGGIATLDLNSKINENVIPSIIARVSDINTAIEGVVAAAPAAFNTLKEIADYIASDQTAAASLATTVGTKLSSSVAETTYATIYSPIFTGIVTIPAGASISGFATSVNLTSGLASTLSSANSYTDTAVNGVSSSLGDYQPESERNQANGYAGLDSGGKILTSAVPVVSNSMLQNNTININGSAIALGGSVITGYTNGTDGTVVNKIRYGTSATPPASGNATGDIYIQY
jgi:hypothetical protein